MGRLPLSAEMRRQACIDIANQHKQLDTTMIYVTHDQVKAITLGDRGFALKVGRIEQAGTPAEIYEVSAHFFIAGGVGLLLCQWANALGASVIGATSSEDK
jgi:ABC-type sugar transport system ATPase subunit